VKQADGQGVAFAGEKLFQGGGKERFFWSSCREEGQAGSEFEVVWAA